MINEWIATLLSVNLPTLVFAVFVALAFASEVGFWCGRLLVKGPFQRMKIVLDDNSSTITNSSLGLLALFLGFTFSSAMDHFELNREAVVKEASAINSVYQYTKLLPEPYHKEVYKELNQYIKIRLETGQTNGTEAAVLDVQSKSKDEQDLLWKLIGQAAAKEKDNPVVSNLLSSMDELVNAELTRTEYLLNNVPNGLFVPVGLFLIFNGVFLGVSLSEGKNRHILLSWGLYLLVALSVAIIIDLDRPLTGLIDVNQSAIEKIKISD